MTVFIIRHAEKEAGDFFNPLLQHQDQPLSRRGQAEALGLWSYLCDKHVSAIYVSCYQRTWQTIHYAAEQLALTPIMDERLNEIDNGSLERMSEEEIQLKFPDVWTAYRKRTTDFRFPGGETGEEVYRRIAGFLEEKRRVHGDDNIVLVSHEGWIRLLLCYIMELPVYKRWNFQVDFCGILEITYQPDYKAWKLIRFNQGLFPIKQE